MPLDRTTAASLAGPALTAIAREYPNKVAHVMLGDGDARPPRELTPMFYGAFDWHSAVHGHWALVRLLRLFPGEPWAPAAAAALDQSFDPARAAGEVAYLAPRPGFEMPYGIAWLLQLDAELAEAGDQAPFARWRGVLAELVALAAERFMTWASRLPQPIRSGEHSQSAFAVGLALDWARATRASAAIEVLVRKTRDWYLADRRAPIDYEPSAYDFLSPALAEADLMRRVLGASEMARWLAGFLPRFDRFEPVAPADRGDGKLVHLDGLNFSRAWMMRGIASALPASHPARAELETRAASHGAAGMAGLSSQHYEGTHWLGSFALYALSARGLGSR